MKRALLLVVLAAVAAFPVFAADTIGAGFSVGIGANRYLADAGIDAADLSLGVSLAFLPIQIDDFAAGVTIRATLGASVTFDDTLIGWYALTPLLTLRFADMSISAGYGPWALADFPDVYVYEPAVVLGFDGFEIGMIGPSVYLGFALGI